MLKKFLMTVLAVGMFLAFTPQADARDVYCGTEPLFKTKVYLMTETIKYNEELGQDWWAHRGSYTIIAYVKTKEVRENGAISYPNYYFTQKKNGEVLFQKYDNPVGIHLTDNNYPIEHKMWETIQNEIANRK